MKVAIITDGLGGGGAERQAVTAAMELARRGVRVDIVAYHPDNVFSAEVSQGGFGYHVVGAGLSRHSQLRRIAQFLRERQYDISHSFKEPACMAGRLASQIAGVPVIFGGYRGQIAAGLARRLMNWALSCRTAGWIVNSEVVKQFVCRHFWQQPEKVFVVPNGVDFSRLQTDLTPKQAKTELGFEPDRPIVTMVGTLWPVKNHPLLLRAARIVASQRPEAAFCLVGEGVDREKLEARSRELGLADTVYFLGRREDMARVLRATDVSVLTSFSEGLPNALIESAGMGLPIVSTDNGGASMICDNGRNGYLVPLDEREFADRVVRLLDDPSLRQEMGQAGQRLAGERFSIPALGENLIAIYRKGLESRS